MMCGFSTTCQNGITFAHCDQIALDYQKRDEAKFDRMLIKWGARDQICRWRFSACEV